MSAENYEPLSEELYWRKKIGDEIRESITRMRVRQAEMEAVSGNFSGSFGCLPSCGLTKTIDSYEHCENIARGQKDKN
jgi:hypothetical protein